jgi:hypothetical protein
MKKGPHLIAILEEGIGARPKIAQRTSRKLLKEWRVILNEKKLQANNKLHSMAFENVISNEIKNQLGKDACVRTRNKKYLGALIGMDFEADVLVEPRNPRRAPVSIISCKITMAPESVKESVGEAYILGKLFKKHRLALQYYLVATHRVKSPDIEEFERVSSPYVHGVYTLTEPQFIDQLVHKLKKTYK